MADNTVTLNFSDVSFTALIGWLQKVQREQQLFVIEATVTARERLDRVDATLSLQRPS
jgi:type II secretory pathway component PulM